MKELSINEKAKAYDEAIEKAKKLYGNGIAEEIFPELKESQDEKIRKNCIHFLELQKQHHAATFEIEECIAWLEKQGEQNPCMVQWKGDNLKEVIDFTGKDKNFEKWFKSFEEYEKYVHEHNNIFKLFNENGSHYEIPVGAWIVKTPDGYNIASNAVLKQKFANKLERLVEPKFDPKTLKPFDKVLFRDYSINREWTCGIFSHANFEFPNPFRVGCCLYKFCIPYNDDTKHLVGSHDEAPEYYRYWED